MQSDARPSRQDFLPSSRIVKDQPICFLQTTKKPEESRSLSKATLFCPLARLSSFVVGGANRDRTGDLLLAKQALSQLSYGPGESLVGLDGFEPSTPALSRRCSNQLSYRPHGRQPQGSPSRFPRQTTDRWWALQKRLRSSRKEVIQPHLPIRLPCYDFTPVTNLTVVGAIPCGFGDRLLVKPTPMV